MVQSRASTRMCTGPLRSPPRASRTRRVSHCRSEELLAALSQQGSGPAGEGRRGFARPRGAARQGRGSDAQCAHAGRRGTASAGFPSPGEARLEGAPSPVSSALRAPAPLGLALGAQCLPRSSDFSFSVRSKRPIHSRLCTSSEYRRLVCALLNTQH